MTYAEIKSDVLLKKVFSQACIKSDKLFLEEFKKEIDTLLENKFLSDKVRKEIEIEKEYIIRRTERHIGFCEEIVNRTRNK